MPHHSARFAALPLCVPLLLGLGGVSALSRASETESPRVIEQFETAALAAGSPADELPDYVDLERYGPGSGLSQSTVMAIGQDSLGYLWVGTQDGLNRFDGHRFEVERFQPEADAPGADTTQGLASSSIDSLWLDAEGWLWLGTNDAGVQRVHLREGRRQWLSPAALGAAQVMALVPRAAGGVWAATPVGAIAIDADFKAQPPLVDSAEPVAVLHRPAQSPLLLGQDCRVLALDDPPRLLWQAPESRGCTALESADDRLWIGTDRGRLYALDADQQVQLRLQLPEDGRGLTGISRLHARANGELLIGLGNGQLWRHRGDSTPSLRRLQLDPAPESAITALFTDDAGVLWIGSYTSGLYRARSLSPLLRRELSLDPLVHGLANRSVRAIRNDPEALLVGLDSGLLVQRSGRTPEVLEALRGVSVRAIEPEPETALGGGWWLGTDAGLWRLPAEGPLQLVPGSERRRVTGLLRESGQLLVSTRSGLLALRLPDLAPQPVPEALREEFLTSLARDRNGRLWLGTNERGIWLWQGEELRQLGMAEGLAHPSVWSLLAEPDGVWVGSFSGGLHRFSLEGQRQRLYAERDGLSSNVVYRILRDGRGRLWLSTNDGLNVLDADGNAVRALRRQDGLRNHEFNNGAGFRDHEGRLWFGGTDGLDVIEPWREEPAPRPARAVISVLRLANQPGSDRGLEPTQGLTIGHAQRLQLGHRDSVVGFVLSAIDHSAPASARLRYRLLGLEDEWTPLAQARAEITYGFLPPGGYRLEVQAAGRDGRFGPVRSLQVDVAPPPWRHPLAWLAYALCVLLLGLAAWGQVRARMRSERALVERLNREVESRTAELEQANHLLVSSNLRLEEANRTDPLTRVANRRDLQQWLDEIAPRIQREVAADPRGRHGLSFFMIDIDDFKRINDSLGHQSGDEVLVEFAERLRHLCRSEDRLVRWGGEEFLLVTRELPREEAAHLAERIRVSIASTALELRSGRQLSLSCSIGFAPWPIAVTWPALGEWEQSVNLADQALYEAKRSGKNRWVGLQSELGVERGALLGLLASQSLSQWPRTGLRIERSDEAQD